MRTTILFFITVLVLTSCDPGLHGDLKVYNMSDSTLIVSTVGYHGNSTRDTAQYTIAPGGSQTVAVLGGLGSNRRLECCPCELQSIYITTGAGKIIKDPADPVNWTIPNKENLRAFRGPDVQCEFYIGKQDVL